MNIFIRCERVDGGMVLPAQKTLGTRLRTIRTRALSAFVISVRALWRFVINSVLNEFFSFGLFRVKTVIPFWMPSRCSMIRFVWIEEKCLEGSFNIERPMEVFKKLLNSMFNG